jgi:hypothetical protein
MTGRQKMRIGWTVLAAGTAVVWIVAFTIMEGYGLTHDDAITLSRYTWEAQRSWPLLFPLMFYLAGALQWGFAVHILWRWNPENANDKRG